MPDARTAAPARIDEATARTPARLWPGTGLCPEAQADGVPCTCVEGECERCGRALPHSHEADR
jgi:hypothetical protein